MTIFKRKRLHLLLLCLAGLSAGCENYLGDEVIIRNANLPSSGQFSILANFLTTDSIFAVRTDRGGNVFSGLTWGNRGRFAWPVVDEPDLDIRLFDSANTELLRFDYIPQDERFFITGNPFDTIVSSRPGYTATNNYRARFATNPLRPGETYRLRVDHPGLGVYEVDQTVPFPLESGRIELGERYQVPLIGGSRTQQPFTVSLSVPPGQERFYAIEVLQYDSGGEIISDFSNLKTADPRVIYFGKERGVRERTIYFKTNKDNSEENVSFELDTEVVFAESGYRIAGIEVRSISPEWYNFIASLIRYNELLPQLNEGFVEPFQLYTNVPGGFGVFGAGTVDTIFVE